MIYADYIDDIGRRLVIRDADNLPGRIELVGSFDDEPLQRIRCFDKFEREHLMAVYNYKQGAK